MSLTVYVIGIIACVLFSAFFSASEMSYSACSKMRLEHERDNGSKKAGIAYRIAEKFDDALSTILVGNNLVNIAASSMGSVAVMLVVCLILWVPRLLQGLLAILETMYFLMLFKR